MAHALTISRKPVVGTVHKLKLMNPRSDEFAGKKVIVVGISSTASDILTYLIPLASKVYMSHRRGALILSQYRNGYPPDLLVNWRRRQVTAFMQRYFPNATRWLADRVIGLMMSRTFRDLDPEWGILPPPSITLAPRALSEHILPFLREGSLTSVKGIRRFRGGKTVEFEDGSVVEDVDFVICATGYKADFDSVPFIERSRPSPSSSSSSAPPDMEYTGPDLPRLYMNLFPPTHASSIVLLCHSALGKNNGFSFSDVTSMAVSNIWRRTSPLPAAREMEAWIDAHHAWVVSRWCLDRRIDLSMVKTWEYQAFLHEAAGTGMENLGWGAKGWGFWWRDRRLYGLMNHGVETAHAFRFFETGKRKTVSCSLLSPLFSPLVFCSSAVLL